jgi:6-phosphogluconolactonase
VGSTGTGRAFIGSFTTAGGRGVITASVDPGTGALTEVGATDAVANPSYLALSADGSVLCTVSETAAGAAAAFDVTGAQPRLTGTPVPVGGEDPTHLSIVGRHVLTANYGSGSVTVLPLRGDRVGERQSVLAHHGKGPNAARQEGPHAHQVRADPSGRWVLSVDLGTDSVRICALDAATGTLTAHGETALKAGSGPRHLVFHPEGTHAYVLNELEPTLTVCRWDADAGTLRPVGETAVVPDGEYTETYASEIVVSHDGRFLWAANRGHDSLSVLALDRSREKPALVTTVGCGGHWPRDLALDLTGRRLYAANERSGDVTWFDIDPATGIPRRAGSIEAPAASCVVFG